jgi:hypothetical protein
MIRHQQEEFHAPVAVRLSKSHGLEDNGGDFREAQLIPASRRATDRDEESRGVRSNMRRQIVRERFALWTH